MLIVALLAGTAVLLATTVGLLQAVRADGLGHRPPPARAAQDVAPGVAPW